jgi:hypothetical protein
LKTLMELCFGRILCLGSRPEQSGDGAEMRIRKSSGGD